MATIKGGTLILDFKDEETILVGEETPLKKDYFSMIKKANGKKLQIINMNSDDEIFNNQVIDVISYVIDGNTIALMCFSPTSTGYTMTLYPNKIELNSF